MADQIAPTFVATLRAGRLAPDKASCVTKGLYALSAPQMDRVTSAALDPSGTGAAQARSWLERIVKTCGI